MKSEIIQALLDEQQNDINNIKEEIGALDTAVNIDEEDTIDPDDLSHQDESGDIKSFMQEELDAATDKYNVLFNYKNFPASTQVENGALIETEEAYYFVGPDFENINFQSKPVIAISLDSPIYEANRDKKVSDTLAIGTTEQKIITIL